MHGKRVFLKGTKAASYVLRRHHSSVLRIDKCKQRSKKLTSNIGSHETWKTKLIFVHLKHDVFDNNEFYSGCNPARGDFA